MATSPIKNNIKMKPETKHNNLYQQDAIGSIIALTDTNGAIKTQYTYDSYGNVTITGEASDNPFQFAGRENDGTGLYYYRARYYSPELQRFIRKDPLGLLGGINKFVYTNNNPVNRTDPLGLSPVDPACWKATNDARISCGNELDKAVENAYKRLEWCEEAYEYCNMGDAMGANPNPKPTKKQCDVLEKVPSYSAARMACAKSPEMKAAIAHGVKCAEAVVNMVVSCGRAAGPVKKD